MLVALSVRRGQLGVFGVEGEALAEVVLHGPVHVLDHAFQVVAFVGVGLELNIIFIMTPSRILIEEKRHL